MHTNLQSEIPRILGEKQTRRNRPVSKLYEKAQNPVHKETSSSILASSSSSDHFYFYNNCQHQILIAEGTIQRNTKRVHGWDKDDSCVAFMVTTVHDASFINPIDPFEEPLMVG